MPDGHRRGAEFVWSDWQFWCAAKYYQVRPGVEWGVGEAGEPEPLFNQAFVYRRAQVVAPQKTGKGPWAASLTCLEAVGPSQFYGWAEKGDGYACSEWGCGCGWEYEYLPGEAMGMRHPSPRDPVDGEQRGSGRERLSAVDGDDPVWVRCRI